jgi:hypothetical protein
MSGSLGRRRLGAWIERRAEQALQREQDKLAIEQDLLPNRSSIRP